MKIHRLSTLAAGLLGFARDVGAWALRGAASLLFSAPTKRCIACFNAFDAALIRGDGRCAGCHRDARGSSPAPVPPRAYTETCAACGLRPAQICDLCHTCEERQHLAGGKWDGPTLDRLKTTPPAPACTDPDCHVGAPHTVDHPQHLMHAAAKELPAR